MKPEGFTSRHPVNMYTHTYVHAHTVSYHSRYVHIYKYTAC